MENSEIEAQKNNLLLGQEKGTYHVKFGVGYFLPHAGAALVALLGVAIFAGATGWKVYISAVVMALFALPLVFILWRTLPSVFDELKVFENGFTYKSRGGIQTCVWPEIKDSSEILDGDRLKTTSIEKRDHEKITFAYKMRGLDVISHALSEYEYDQLPDEKKARPEDIAAEPQTLGELRAVYGVRRRAWDYVPAVTLLFLAVFGIGAFLASREVIALFVCSLPPVIIFVLVARSLFSSRRDELKIFENGFTYQDRKALTSCLWEEIADYNFTGKTLERRGDDLTGVKKDNGPWIVFAEGLQGRDELLPHVRKLIEWTGPEE